MSFFEDLSPDRQEKLRMNAEELLEDIRREEYEYYSDEDDNDA